MYSWDRLTTLHCNPPDYKILRNDKVQYEYDKFIKNIKENNININDYIYNKYLSKLPVNFIKNSFPYDIESNCHHYIIWFDNDYFEKLTSCINQNRIINNIVQVKFKNNEYLYLENLDSNKSIKKIKNNKIIIKK